MKRLLVRLSLLSLLTAVGVFAIVQAQSARVEKAARPPAGGESLPPQVPGVSPLPVAASNDHVRDSRSRSAWKTVEVIPLPAQWRGELAAGDYVLPAPTTIVRGNNEPAEDTTEDPPSELRAGDEPPSAAPLRQPAANLLAQAGGVSNRAQNPFARRDAYQPSASEYGATNDQSVLAAQPRGAATYAGGPSNPAAGESEFPVASPTLAAPPADRSANPGALRASPEHAANAGLGAGEYGGYGGHAPPALGAPRELAPYSAAGEDGTTYAPPRPLEARSSRTDEAGSSQPWRRESEPSGLLAPTRDRGPSPPPAVPRYAPSAAVGIEGAGVPGPQNLEGAQTPSVTLKKVAPPEIQIGKPAAFEIHVQNVGRIPAHQVIVKEEIPRGVQLIDAAPPASPQSGALLWELGTLQPGDSRQIKVQYLPIAEGDIGSVAVAAFQAQASVRTICTRPQLTVEQAAPEKVLLGQSFTVRIRLANPGTGVATKVVLEEDVPEGFAHPSGRALEYEVGELRPGESRDLDLMLQAAKPGEWRNALVVRGEGNLAVESTAKIEVVAPQLVLAMTGPTRRYLERQATYTVAIANPGTSTANDVRIVGRLPKGMKFVAANNEGQYDPKTHAVVWSLAELPPGQQGQIQLTALPVETGEQKIVVEGKGSLDTAAQTEHAVTVEALAELAFEIADKSDPIEVNQETTYEIKVANKGSKTATNIRVTAIFPPDMKPLAGDGPARAEVGPGRVAFEPLVRLNPREQAIFRIQALGLRPGDQRIQVQIVSDDSPTPVTKEESTRIYTDQ